MPEIQRAELPEILTFYPQVKGVCAGECIDPRVNERCHVLAHSHSKSAKLDPYFGWICFANRYLLQDMQLVRHELAHILTGHGHDNVWRAKVLELGGHLEKYSFDAIIPISEIPSGKFHYEVGCYREDCVNEPELSEKQIELLMLLDRLGIRPPI